LRREQGLAYDPDREILITDGATLGVCAALGALVGPGDRVLLPDPIYDAYAGPIAMWGGSPTPVPAALRDGRFVLERRGFEGSWVGSPAPTLRTPPWTPVGPVLSRAELAGVMAAAAAQGAAVLSDEIYESLVYDDRRHTSPASVSDDARRRTV